MGRKRKDEKDIKVNVSIRLRRELIEKIKKVGSLQKVIEKILEDFFK